MSRLPDDFPARLTRLCGVPTRFLGLDLDGMDDGGDRDYRAALARVRELSRDLRVDGPPDDGLYLYLVGNFGSGKTRLATWVLREVYAGILERGVGPGRTSATRPLFVEAKRFGDLRFLRREDEDVDDERVGLRERLFTSTLLVIDDVSRIAGYKGEVNFLEDVVETRYNECLSTVLTGNTPDVTETLGARLADFVGGYFEVLALGGPSRVERAGTDA